MRRDPQAETGRALRGERSRGPAEAASASAAPMAGTAATLFEGLRGVRAELAREQGVPAYVIFHDTTLKEMAVKRPADRAAFAALTGVGGSKLERYADIFLAAIRTLEGQ